MTTESKSAFARRRGRSPSAVGQWIRFGLLSGAALEGSGRTARINVEIAEAQLAARLDPGQAIGNGAAALKAPPALKSKPSKPPAKAESDDESDETPEIESAYAHQKSRLAQAQAEAQELKNALARGEQVDVAQVERHWSTIANTIKARFLAIPGRLRRARPHLGTDDLAAFDREIRDVLTDLAKFQPL